jgi:MFS family permease
LSRQFRRFVILSSVFALGAFSYSFLLMFARDVGLGKTLVIALYPLFTAAAAGASWISGHLSDRIGRKPVLIASYALWMVVCVNFILVQKPALLIFSFVLYGMHKGVLVPVQRTIVSECAPSAFRASCLGGFHMITGLCALPASFVAGLLWETFGTKAPFVLSLGLTFIAALLLITFKPEQISEASA